MSNWLRALTAPIMIPFFLLQAVWEVISTPVDRDDLILMELSPRNREVWKKLTPDQKKEFRARLQVDETKQAIRAKME